MRKVNSSSSNDLNKKIPQEFLALKDMTRLKDLFSKVYAFFGAEENCDLVLTECYEEAVTQLFTSHYQKQMFSSGQTHIITTDCMSLAQKEMLDKLKKFGVEYSCVKKNANGFIDTDELKKNINPRTSLISIIWAHPITGIVQPLNDVIEIAREYDISLHVDVSAAIGHMDIDLSALKIDYLTFFLDKKSSSDVYSSGLIASPYMGLEPLILGYGIQKLKGGTFSMERLQNLVNLLQDIEENMYENLMDLPQAKTHFIKRCEETWGKDCLLLKNIETLPSRVVVSIPYLHADYFRYILTQADIYHCAESTMFPSLKELLNPLQISKFLKDGAVSFDIESLKDIDMEKFICAVQRALDPIKKTFEHIEKVSF